MYQVDIEKAFDSVDHIFLCSSLKKFGFGTEFLQWIKLILNKQESCILNDGHSSGFFPLSSGTRQGDPISAFFFILVMEILYKYLITRILKVSQSLSLSLSYLPLLMMFHTF